MTSSTSKPNHPTGFTLVEIIVTMSVIVVLAVVTIMTITSLSSTQALTNAKNVVRAALVTARNNANTGQMCCGNQLPSGYGVYWTMNGVPDTQFFIYADMDTSHNYTVADTIISNGNLESSINFTNCSNVTTTTTTGTCDILFTTSTSSTVYYSGAALAANATIQVKHAPSNQTGSITVYNYTSVVE